MKPSNLFDFSGIEIFWQQTKDGIPDVPLASNTVQLLKVVADVFSSQMGYYDPTSVTCE